MLASGVGAAASHAAGELRDLLSVPHPTGVLHRVGLDRSDQYTWDALTDPNFLKRGWESGASLRALLANLGQPARAADVLRNGRIPGGETRAFFEMYSRGREELQTWLTDGGAAHVFARLP